MKRIAPPLALALASPLVAVAGIVAVHNGREPATEVLTADAAVISTPVVPDRNEFRELKASRSRALPVASPTPRHHVIRPKPRVASPALKRASVGGCTSSNWRSTLGTDELWIDERESGVNPRSVNPSSGARGLGQLLESTYRDLGLTPSWDPCEEIYAQRAYMRGRYGSWGNARAWWENHRWW